jgi:cytochrome c oxidase cbb3-type subunit IV
MDIGTLRGLLTLALFVAFIALVIWAYSKRRKTDFDKLARMPLEDDPPAKDSGSKTHD